MDRLLMIALGIGLDKLLNGEVPTEIYESGYLVAGNFLDVYHSGMEVKKDYIELLGASKSTLPSKVFLHNMKAILIKEAIEQIILAECNEEEQ